MKAGGFKVRRHEREGRRERKNHRRKEEMSEVKSMEDRWVEGRKHITRNEEWKYRHSKYIKIINKSASYKGQSIT